MSVIKYIIYLAIEGKDIYVLMDKNLPSLELNESITIDTVNDIIQNIWFKQYKEFHSEHSKIYQTNFNNIQEISIVDYTLISKEFSKIRKGTWSNIFDVAKDSKFDERYKIFIREAAEKV